MKRNRTVLFLGSIAMLVAVTFIHFGCKHDPVVFSNVCFESDVLPIFQSNCSMCHGQDKAEGDIRLDSYDNIMKDIKAGNAKGSKIYKAISSGSMPPSSKPKLTGKQIAVIYSWIQNGAENCSSCDTVNVSYSSTIKGILDNKCNSLDCHGAGEGTDLSTYQLLHDYLASDNVTILTKIFQSDTNNFSAMPPKPAAKLDDCSLNQIRSWIHAGYPNN